MCPFARRLRVMFGLATVVAASPSVAPALVRWTRVILALATFAAATVAGQGVAAADLTITGANIDGKTGGGGVSSASSPPGGVLEAKVTVSRTDGSDWRGTDYRFGSDSFLCRDTENETSDGDHTNSDTFNVTAPGMPGDYDADFKAWQQDNCTGNGSPVFPIPAALNVTAPANNKDLPEVCGLDMMLILDESGSIGTGSNRTAVRNAAKAFVGSLSGTGSKVAVLEFNSRARQAFSYTTVTQDWVDGAFNRYITDVANNQNDQTGSGYDPGNYADPENWTNWEDAFRLTRQLNAAAATSPPTGPVADLVVFVTDGDPTARNIQSPPGFERDLDDGSVLALRPAAVHADEVKVQGSHIFSVGVGAAVTGEGSERRLTAVSEFDEYRITPPPGAPFTKADYTLVQNFEDLAKALKAIATELCGASVTITKEVDPEGDGTYVPAGAGWGFTADVSTDPGSYTWVTPPPKTAPPPSARFGETDGDGELLFQWKPGNATAVSTVSIVETPEPDYKFDNAECTVTRPALSRRGQIRTRVLITPGDIPQISLRPGEYATCKVRNSRIPTPTGTITIIKDAVPDSAHIFRFTGTPPINEFTLSDDNNPSPPTEKTFTGLVPGTYVVSEAQQNPALRLAPGQRWELTGIVCSEGAQYVVEGAQVSINLAAGQAVSCTFQNTRGNEPEPPDPQPPDPPDPPPIVPPPLPPPPPPTPEPPRAQLQVEKTAPVTARVGQRVRFSLTVTNVGAVPAEGVRMADVPPAAMTLGGLRASSRPRLRGRAAIWRIGTLAPGASRTIRGSVRITKGAPV